MPLTHLAGVLCTLIILSVVVTGAPETGGLTRPYTPVADLTEALADKLTVNPNNAHVTPTPSGGKTRPSIFQHPDATGKPLATLTLPPLQLPVLKKGERLVLRVYTGIKDGADAISEYDGVRFILKVNGRTMLDRRQCELKWIPATVDLSAQAGSTVRITMQTDPLQNSACDWAAWGEPEIRIDGRPSAVPMPTASYLRLDALDRRYAAPQREIGRAVHANAFSVLATTEPVLDLPWLVRRDSHLASSELAYAPPVAVGQGPNPANHTLIRVFDRFGACQAQFLAYPLTVRGGVQVRYAHLHGVGDCLVAAPATDAFVRTLKLIAVDGAPLAEVVLPADVKTPVSLMTGDFLSGNPGDEIAVMSQNGDSPLYVLTAEGLILAARPIADDWKGRRIGMDRVPVTGGHELLLWREGAPQALHLFGPKFLDKQIALPIPVPAGGSVHPDPYRPGGWIVSLPDRPRSSIMRVDTQGQVTRAAVDDYETLFWLQYDHSTFQIPDRQHVRRSVYHHIRTDGRSGGLKDALRPLSDTTHWAGTGFGDNNPLIQRFTELPPGQWNLCFTHRMPIPWAERLKDRIDPEAGTPEMFALSRRNRLSTYGEFGTSDFETTSYNLETPALDALYILPLRIHLQQLVRPFRQAPEHFAGIDPNHEHEIAIEQDGSVGDYNPRMIQGFYGWLKRQYGIDRTSVNKQFGAPFRDVFDAPRQERRGAWDEYNASNPFYSEWVEYNRTVVNARIAQTLREALLAGFPPEITAQHQIPDSYAFGSLGAFSTLESRLSPVDWSLNCGTAFGFTRYGVWYNRPHDALQDAFRSGFNRMQLGEYQALTPNQADATGQLRFIRDHGGASIHCMNWPAAFDKGFNAAMEQAILDVAEDDAPRVNLQGGVGEVRSAARPNGSVMIACLGVGDRPGLLKSLTDSLRWEGSTYLQPFHSAVEVTDVPIHPRGRGVWRSAPVNQLASGCQLQLDVELRATQTGTLQIHAERIGRVLPGMTHSVSIKPGQQSGRYVLRIQAPISGLQLVIQAPEGVHVRAALSRHEEWSARLTANRLDGRPYRGGIYFDVLPEEVSPYIAGGKP